MRYFLPILILIQAFSTNDGQSTTACTQSGSSCINATQPTVFINRGFEHPYDSQLGNVIHELFIFIYLLVFVTGVSGNAMVCYILGRKEKLRKGDIFIVSLAIADLIACIIWPLHMVTYHSYILSDWFFDPVTQSVFFFIFYTTLMVSSWQLLLISIDRYWAITKLLEWQRISSKKKIAAVVFTWLLAICVKFPLTWRKNFGISDHGYKVYLMIWTCLGWVIPLIVVSILYGICIKTLYSNAFQSDAGEAAKRRRKEDRRVVKMFIIIVALYFIFTIPHSVVDLFRYIDNKSADVILIHECSVILVLFNSCTNPFIYARMHRDINGFIRNMWRKMKGKKAKSLDSTTEGASAESVL